MSETATQNWTRSKIDYALSVRAPLNKVMKVYFELLTWVTMTTLQQLRVTLFEPFTKGQHLILCALFWQESLLPQRYDPLPSLAVFQLGGTHT